MVMKKELLNKMKLLRKEGKSYNEISLELGINVQKVMYHLNKNYREWRKEASRGNYDKSKRKYYKDYVKKRYKTDKEFREKKKKFMNDKYKNDLEYRERKKRESREAYKKKKEMKK